jgi:hypothetical protein
MTEGPLEAYWKFLDAPRCECKRRLMHNCLGPPKCRRPNQLLVAISSLQALVSRMYDLERQGMNVPASMYGRARTLINALNRHIEKERKYREQIHA